MENLLGAIRIQVLKGIDLVSRDTRTSDPYVVLTIGDQKVQTKVKKGTLNPEWNEELTLTISDPTIPITLEVYDKDTVSTDDKMGDAEIDIQALVYAVRMGHLDVPNGTAIRRVQPNRENHLSEESNVLWNDGSVVQDMILRLENVDKGEIEIKMQWAEIPGAKGGIRVRVLKGIKLVRRDIRSSDPYVVLILNDQKLRTTVKRGTLNPEWNEDITLKVRDLSTPIKLEVYDWDRTNNDDPMGDAEIDIEPLIFAVQLGYLDIPNGTAIQRVQPEPKNCLSNESNVEWMDGIVVQDMILRLRNVKRGEIQIQIQWVNLPGGKGLDMI
ncbi:hypothetical protein ZOSMA_389G00070 [Zostera marina]|uniref:C2 domain-containing protein n=1 Tax=Zostera marina TaxID=29655 RepID=A0A0K9P4V7_ZOSMR|nr:hypothetical protein ZOSMA_389G00070 [Zostera marina]